MSGLFGKPKAPAPLPPPAPPALMPVADDMQSKRAQKRRTAEIARRGGRVSTILTGGTGDDKLG